MATKKLFDKKSLRSQKGKSTTDDPAKAEVLRQLTVILQQGGFTVRREELKRGPGWRAVSGVCRANDRRFIFVDRHLTYDDQILFLASKIGEHGVVIPEDQLSQLPSRVREMFA